MANTFKFGNGNWAVKDGYALAYNDENNNFKPLPFDFTRASSATRVNKQGLVETVPSGKPRIDFLNNTSGHLLLEPSRTNKITYSQDLSDSSWIKSGNGTGSTPVITSNAALSPDGTVNANRIDLDLNGGTGSGDWSWLYFNFTGTGVSETISFWIKAVDTANVGKVISIGSFSPQSYTLTSDWVRVQSTSSSTGAFGTILRLRGNESTSDTASFYIYGIQLEVGSYATSYIPTEGSTVTRSKDDIDTNYGNINSLSGEVSVYFNLLPQVSAASNNNKCLMFGFNSSSNTQSYANLRFGSTNWASRIQGTTGNNFNDLGVDKTTEIKAVMVLTQSGYSLYANGSTALASGSYGGTAPTINSVAYVQILNDSEDRGIYKIKELKVYNTALTASEAINLTS